MTKQAEIVLMNLSKMAGGPGDLNHGKQIIQQMHNVEWTNARTRMEELALNKQQFAFATKPLMKGVIMPPFINEPVDLSVGEFATLMGAASQWAQMQGQGQGGMPEWLLKDYLNRFQTLEDRLSKEAEGDEKKLQQARAKAYNDPKSDYRTTSDIISQLSYASAPIFRQGPEGPEPVPWSELPREMTEMPKKGFPIIKWFQKKQTLMAPQAQSGFGEQPAGKQAIAPDFSAGELYLRQGK